MRCIYEDMSAFGDDAHGETSRCSTSDLILKALCSAAAVQGAPNEIVFFIIHGHLHPIYFSQVHTLIHITVNWPV